MPDPYEWDGRAIDPDSGSFDIVNDYNDDSGSDPYEIDAPGDDAGGGFDPYEIDGADYSGGDFTGQILDVVQVTASREDGAGDDESGEGGFYIDPSPDYDFGNLGEENFDRMVGGFPMPQPPPRKPPASQAKPKATPKKSSGGGSGSGSSKSSAPKPSAAVQQAARSQNALTRAVNGLIAAIKTKPAVSGSNPTTSDVYTIARGANVPGGAGSNAALLSKPTVGGMFSPDNTKYILLAAVGVIVVLAIRK